MRRFLTFAVEKALAGEAEDLKEYTVGVEVFDRTPDFDPRADSIVRVEARRLRSKLRKHYEVADSAGPGFRIELPEGSYAPIFVPSSPPADSRAAENLNSGEVSLAVLPFSAMGGDEEAEFFADGLTEELINVLSEISELRVVARTSVFGYKGQTLDVRKIAEELGVAKILEGSVRQVGRQVRVTVQLINSADGLSVWSHRFDRDMESVFDLQDEISSLIADTFRIQLRGTAAAPVYRHVVPGEAYRLFLQGRYFAGQLTPGSLRKAVEYYQRALQVDSEFAVGYAGLASALLKMSFFGEVAPSNVLREVRNLVDRGGMLNPRNAEIHALRGLIRASVENDLPEARGEFETALSLTRNDPESYVFFSVGYLMPMRKFDESEEHLKRALRIDPMSLLTNTALGIHYYYAGQIEEALEQLERTASISERYYGAHRFWACALGEQGDWKEAEQILRRAVDLGGSDPRPKAALAYVLAKAGAIEESLALEKELLDLATRAYVARYDLAMVQVGLGNLEEASAQLRRAAAEGEIWLIHAGIDPMWKPLVAQPGLN
jgi:TolB-like protein/lipoprotein NlpI